MADEGGLAASLRPLASCNGHCVGEELCDTLLAAPQLKRNPCSNPESDVAQSIIIGSGSRAAPGNSRTV